MLDAELEDDQHFVLRTRCEHGHRTSWIVQHQRFELLFELGVYAIVDSYTREAIMNFATAWERFMEFYIEVAMKSTPLDARTQLLRMIKSRSERELGAFAAVFTMTEGAVPPGLSESSIAMRNRIAHHGYIPTEIEAKGFGEEVERLVISTLRRMWRERADDVEAKLRERLALPTLEGDRVGIFGWPAAIHAACPTDDNGNRLPDAFRARAMDEHVAEARSYLGGLRRRVGQVVRPTYPKLRVTTMTRNDRDEEA